MRFTNRCKCLLSHRYKGLGTGTRRSAQPLNCYTATREVAPRAPALHSITPPPPKLWRRKHHALPYAASSLTSMEWDSPRTLTVDQFSKISAFPLRIVVRFGKKVDGVLCTQGFDRSVDSSARKRLQLQRCGPRASFRSRIAPSPLTFIRVLQLIDPSRFMPFRNVLGRVGKTPPLKVRHCDRQYDVPGLGSMSLPTT